MQLLLRPGHLALCLLLLAAPARAEWQVKPFGGVTFGGSTTFVDLDRAAGDPKLNLGASVLVIGNVVGLEGDVATTSGFFNGRSKLVLKSHVATATGNVVVALPKRMAQYSLRPYAVGGVGLMHVALEDNLAALPFSNALWAWNAGGGATGFLSDIVGLNWDVRYFRTLKTESSKLGVSVGPEELSFWRATMGLSMRL